MGTKMKTLETVAVGDTVRIIKSIRYGWGEQKKFWVNIEVTRVTLAQFTADGNRYRKSDGAEVGGPGIAEPARQDGSDQSAEMARFADRCRHVHSARITADRVKDDLSPDHPHLYEIGGLLAQVEALIGEKK